jgi:AcrR family transcriptional regulator
MPQFIEKQRLFRSKKIEAAALELFQQRGFHAVGLREIAGRAGVSLGNIYNYYSDKEALFRSILERLFQAFLAEDEPLLAQIEHSRFPEDLEELGQAVGEMVARHSDYLTMVHLDIAEFGGAHARSHYDQLTPRFEAVLGSRFAELRSRASAASAVDPAVAFSLIYLQFFTFFIVERVIGARQHLGLTETEAIQAISHLARHGLAGPQGERPSRGELRRSRGPRRG